MLLLKCYLVSGVAGWLVITVMFLFHFTRYIWVPGIHLPINIMLEEMATQEKSPIQL
jgi:uncharacterized membrane protein